MSTYPRYQEANVDEPEYGPGDRVVVKFQPESIEAEATVIEQRGAMVVVQLDDHDARVTTGIQHVSRLVGRV